MRTFTKITAIALLINLSGCAVPLAVEGIGTAYSALSGGYTPTLNVQKSTNTNGTCNFEVLPPHIPGIQKTYTAFPCKFFKENYAGSPIGTIPVEVVNPVIAQAMTEQYKKQNPGILDNITDQFSKNTERSVNNQVDGLFR